MDRREETVNALSDLNKIRQDMEAELNIIIEKWTPLVDEAERKLEEVCDHFYLVKSMETKMAEWPEGGRSKTIYTCPDCKKRFDWQPPYDKCDIWIEIDSKRRIFQRVERVGNV